MTIKLGPGLSLPDDAVTQTFGILAKRGAGKSNTGAVMAEGMFDAGLPFVVIDPVGAWWGLRSSSDGSRPGLPIPIFGGHRGDVPLEPTGGELIADLVVDERLSCVLDVSAFESEGAKRRFLASFAERLFRRKGQPGHDDPLHLFLEEADDYAPQRASGIEVNRTLGAFQRIVKQARARGLGSTMITQRSAVLNKDLLTQIETLIVMRTTSPQDRKAISAWVEYHGQSAELLASLHELKDGEAWVWSPWLDLTKRVHIRRRRTFDSGATPNVKTKGKRIATLADIDLGSIQQQMADTIERVKESDPKELRRRIAELERLLRNQPSPEPSVQCVEVPVVPEGFMDVLAETQKLLERTGNDLSVVGDGLSEMRSLVARVQGSQIRMTTNTEAAATPSARPAATTPRVASGPGDATLNKAEKSILAALAVFPEGKSKRSLGVVAGYSWKGGGFNNALSSLRTKELITRGDPIRITESGITALGSNYDPLPTGLALVDYWSRQLGKAEKAILQALVDSYPQALTKAEIGERTGYEPGGGGFNNALSKLRTLELVEGRGEMKAADVLMR